LGTARERSRRTRPGLTRHAIVTAARKIITVEGHETLTLRRLMGELGVTAPALYAHFESKEAVLRAVAHAEFEWSVSKEGTLRISEIADPVERLREICLRFIDYVRDNREVFRLLLMFPPDFFQRENFEVADPPTSLGGRVFRARAEAIHQAIDEGRFREEDPFVVGLTLFTAVHGLATFLLMEPNLKIEVENRLISSVIDSVLRGLSASENDAVEPPPSTSSVATGRTSRGRSRSREA
jgi:AcrR family transcriptional regulator